MSSLTALAADIQREHEAAHGKASEALEHARRAGELLIKAKERLEHGAWLTWLSGHCGVSSRSAQRYMRLASRWGELESKHDTVSHLTLQGALDALRDDGVGDLTPRYNRARMLLQRLRDVCGSSGPLVPFDVWCGLYSEVEQAVADARAVDEVAVLLEAEQVTKAQALELYARQAKDTGLELGASMIRGHVTRWLGLLSRELGAQT
jgi:hypothetical protein